MFSTNSYAYQGLHKTSDVLNETVSNGKNFINNDLGNFSDSINTSVSILESTILNTLNGCFFFTCVYSNIKAYSYSQSKSGLFLYSRIKIDIRHINFNS